MPTQYVSTTGRVTSGRGNARRHISENAGEIRLLTDAVLFPGSLNLILHRPLFLSNVAALRFANTQRLLWPGRLNGIPVWLYRWQQTPLHILEVLSETRLRDRLNLKDGDTVEIEVDQTYVDHLSRTRYLAWLALWGGRGHWAYTYDGYYWKTRSLAIDLGTTQDNGDHSIMRNIARGVLGRLKDVPLLGPAVTHFSHSLQTAHPPAGQAGFVFARDNPDFCETPTDRELARIRNLLNYTKTSGSAYAAKQYPAGYHTLEIFGQRLPGQRDPRSRFRNLPFDFRGKRVLDIGTNQGGMLLAIRDQIEFGIGLDYDPRMVNCANRLAASMGAGNLHYYVFDLEKDPLDLMFDLIPGGRIDVVFLLSVCMWIENWQSVIRHCAENAQTMMFESNGTDAQQAAQESALRTHFGVVQRIEECSDDDPSQKHRQLFLCEEARRTVPTTSDPVLAVC